MTVKNIIDTFNQALFEVYTENELLSLRGGNYECLGLNVLELPSAGNDNDSFNHYK